MGIELKTKRNLIIGLVVAVVIVAAFVGGGFYWWQKDKGAQKACTMEARQCSDGSYVGRTGPNCEFTACPIEK